MLSLLLFILILGVIVLVHEFGHFIFAKMFGIYVYEFSIGMGPKLYGWKKKNGETDYSIRLIPIGGYCSLAGEGNDEDGKLPKDRLLQSKPAWQRFLVMFFGAGNNFILAFLILFFMGLVWGAPSNTPVLANVEEGTPAYVAGLRSGDIVTKVNGKDTPTLDDLSMYIQFDRIKEEDMAKDVTFEIKREDGSKATIKVTPEKKEVDGETTYLLGIQLGSTEVNRDVGSILKYPFEAIGSLFKQMFITLEKLFTGGVSVSNLSGPVGIYSIVDEQASAGVENILYLIALLSVNVGFLNLLPFPAFDGGRILFLVIEKIKGSPVKPETENMIHNIGFFLLLALMLYVTFNDILKLF